MDGAINLGGGAQLGADVVHELAQFPWALESDAFDQVYAFDVIAWIFPAWFLSVDLQAVK